MRACERVSVKQSEESLQREREREKVRRESKLSGREWSVLMRE